MAFTPVDVARFGALAAIAVNADMDNTGRQKTDRRTQLPRWKVQCLLKRHEEGRAQLINITIPSQTEPDFVPMTQVVPTNLVAMDWATDNGHGLAYFADGLEEVESTGLVPSFAN